MAALVAGVGLVLLVGPRADAAADAVPYLGVRLLDVPPALAAQLEIDGGALIADVVAGSPAESAGLERFDVLTKAQGKAISGPAELRDVIRSLEPGAKLALEVLRRGKRVEVAATLGEAPAGLEERGDGGKTPPPPEPERRPGFLGIRFGPVPPALAGHLGLEAGSGVMVERVLDGSGAAKAGIERFDVVTHVKGEPIRSVADLPRLLGGAREGDTVEVRWIHRGGERKADVTLGPPPQGKAFGPPGGRRFPFGWTVPGIPHGSVRGKIHWKDAEGNEHTIEIPEIEVPDLGLPDGELETWKKSFLKRFGEEDWKELPDDLQKRVDELIRKFEGELEEHLDLDLRFGDGKSKDGAAARTPGPSIQHRQLFRSGSKRVAVTRSVKDGYDIEIREEDGTRTVTVRKDGKVIAEKLPWEKLDTLSDEVREKVKDVSKSLPRLESSPPVRGTRI